MHTGVLGDWRKAEVVEIYMNRQFRRPLMHPVDIGRNKPMLRQVSGVADFAVLDDQKVAAHTVGESFHQIFEIRRRDVCVGIYESIAIDAHASRKGYEVAVGRPCEIEPFETG